MEEWDQLQQSIGAPLEPETVVEVMMRGQESWDKIACYFRHVITKKTEKEAEIQRMTNHRDPRTRGSTCEEMCVPVSVRVSVRACVCERADAGRDGALDGSTQMRINCRA